MSQLVRPAAFLIALLVASLAYTMSVTAQGAGEPMILPTDADPLIVHAGEGEVRFTIEIADTPERRARGLMFREDMADDHGMLFVFEQTGRVGFWMENTPMELDLVFVGEDGRVRAVERGEPFSRASIGPAAPVRFVLEIRHGMAEMTGIREGTLLSHPRIDAVAGGG